MDTLALDDGSEHDVADWEAAAAAVLRKSRRLPEDAPDADVWSALSHTTLDGVEVSPLGTPAQTEDQPTEVRPTRAGGWDVRSIATTNADALAELEGGATSLWVDDVAVLDGVLLDVAAVVLGDPGQADALVAKGPLHPDSNLGHPAAEVTDEQVAQARDAGVLGFVVDAVGAHDRGASDAQELAWSLWLGATYLRRGGPAELVEFRYAATDDQFATIAKLRAARRLWARMLELSDLERVPQRQHAVTSTMMTSRYDPHVNLLRTTVAAFAAGVGGADAVTVVPFDAPRGESSVLGRRLARNVSHLLIEESHLGVVADAAGGAYAVERYTDDLAQAAWTELGRIETEGPDAFHARVAEVAADRERQVATRQWPLTGLSEFPRGDEDVAPGTAGGYGAAFEALRDEPTTRPAFLATMGPLAGHSARATWATNLLAAGGVAVQPAGPTDGVGQVLEAYAGQPVACLAGADATYAEWGLELVDALREAGARWVVVAGKPATRDGQSLGVDGSARVGDDVLAFLTTVREHLA